MAFLTDLRDGTHGVRIDFPSALPVEQDLDYDAVLHDAGHSVTWHLGLMPEIVDLSEKHADLLIGDLELEAWSAFKAHYHARRAEAGAPPAIPRINDPEWAPVVSTERIAVAGCAALIVIHRLAYSPCDESIAGRVLVPLEQGTLHLSALCRTTATGYRESELTARRLSAATPPAGWVPGGRTVSRAESEAAIRRALPSQAEIDDPALDATYPEHPLSVVRAALRWLLGEGPAIQITRPVRARPGGSVELVMADCVITPPPRFVLSPMLAARMSPTMAPFHRGCLPGVDHQLFGVWRVPGARITGIGRSWRLRRLADRNARGWTAEGASKIMVDTWSLPSLDGRTRAGSYVQFSTVDGPTHSLAEWIVDHDGAVFRVTAGGPPDIGRDTLAQYVGTAVGTWRRETSSGASVGHAD